jgi:hypothetical protein
MHNQHDAKDAPEGSDSMAYVRPWERLPDAIKRITVGGRSIEVAQSDLCRAIADRAVRIRVKLGRHMKGFTAWDTILPGTALRLSAEIKPEDLDWEKSRPVKPWMVARGSFSIWGPWLLEWIEVCRADVTNVLCRTRKQDEAPQNASSETWATSTSRGPVENQGGPFSSGSMAGQSAARSGRRRGARPQKFEQTKDAMRNDIVQGRCTAPRLENMLEKHLAENYGVSRDTARRAREAVLSELNSRQIPTNNK